MRATPMGTNFLSFSFVFLLTVTKTWALSFGTKGYVNAKFDESQYTSAYTGALQTDGKILAAGYLFPMGGGVELALVRLNEDGSLDLSFGKEGRVRTNIPKRYTYPSSPTSLNIQKDGKIVQLATSVSFGEDSDFGLIRYLANGSLDASFGDHGIVLTDIDFGSDDSPGGFAIQDDGKLLACGSTKQRERTQSALLRFLENGDLDSTFGNGGRVVYGPSKEDRCTVLAVLPDGKIVTAGQSQSGTRLRVSLIRYLQNGDIDTSFGTHGTVMPDLGSDGSEATSIHLQANDKWLVSGRLTNEQGGAVSSFVARLLPDGSLDLSFNQTGKLIVPAAKLPAFSSMLMQPDGDFVMVGTLQKNNSSNFGLLKYKADGSLDTAFGSGGEVCTVMDGKQSSSASSAIVQVDGKIVVVGTASDKNGSEFAVARYLAHGDLDALKH